MVYAVYTENGVCAEYGYFKVNIRMTLQLGDHKRHTECHVKPVLGSHQDFRS